MEKAHKNSDILPADANILGRRGFIKSFIYGAAGVTVLGNLPFRSYAAAPWDGAHDSLMVGEETPGITAGPKIDLVKGTSLGYPNITEGKNGRIYLAWSETDGGYEQILLKSYNPATEEWGDLINVSGPDSLAFQTQIITVRDNILIVWTSKKDGYWSIKSRVYDTASGKLKPVNMLVERGTITRPALVNRMNGALLAWEEVYDGKLVINTAHLSGDGMIISKAIEISEFPGKDCTRVALAASPGGDEIAFAYDVYEGEGNFNVYLGRISAKYGRIGKLIKVSDHPAADIAPALAYSTDGKLLWVGWQSNRRGHDTWDIPRWYRLAALQLSSNTLMEPVSPPKMMDLDKKDTDQGFEFPRLLALPDGKICVLGRPSHNFCIQWYHGDEWSDLMRFPLDGWGGRGQKANAIMAANSSLWVTRRDIWANVVQELGGVLGENKKPALKKVEPGKVEVLSNLAKPWQFPPQGLWAPGANTRRDDPIDSYNFYFGDIHAHTWMSDGMGDPDEYFIRNRDCFGYDFSALTDHDNFVGQRFMNSEYEQQKDVVEHHNEPGKFVTLFAQEWTTGRPTTAKGFGHINFYTTNPDHPMMDHKDPRWDTDKKVFAEARKYGMIGFHHHIGWTGIRWDNFDPEIETCVEICSVHGAFEYYGNEPIPHRGSRKGEFIQDGLARGLKFGIVGGSDQHGLIWQHRVCWKRNSYQAGLTGVLAKELTREAIFEAFKKRRTFASTGVRIGLGFTINDNLMGSEITTDEAPLIRIDVKSEKDLKWIEIVRNNETILKNGGEGFHTRITLRDQECPTDQTSWYYLRVIHESGDMAWSSPIWVTRKA